MTNYSFKSMTEQANAIQENLISPVKLLEEFLKRYLLKRNLVKFLLKFTSMRP